MTLYHVANSGNDGDPGTEAQPWATVAKVNDLTLVPGDSALFRRRDAWIGTELVIADSGQRGAPITVGSYGEGPLPILSNPDQLGHGVLRLAGQS